jgi:hypothetical protein
MTRIKNKKNQRSDILKCKPDLIPDSQIALKIGVIGANPC